MSETSTIECPQCDRTLIGDNTVEYEVCGHCVDQLAHQIGQLSVQGIWQLVDQLKARELEGQYAFSGIQQRIQYLTRG